MPRGRLSRAVALLLALAALSLAASASGALVIVNGIVLHADGGFQPRLLPEKRFAPIDFQGFFDITARGGGVPPALQRAEIDFDRDGRLGAAGLPICAPEQVAAATPEQARRICKSAVVGTGHISALISLPEGLVAGSSLLTIFNGPRQGSNPTVVLHARTTVPAPETYAIVVPIERRPGAFRYRATLDIPPIAGGLGVLAHLDVDVGRRFSAGGQKRSYISAHCSDGILHTHGRFTFADGTIVDGSVEKACTAR
jgi:hypothetical protein